MPTSGALGAVYSAIGQSSIFSFRDARTPSRNRDQHVLQGWIAVIPSLPLPLLLILKFLLVLWETAFKFFCHQRGFSAGISAPMFFGVGSLTFPPSLSPPSLNLLF
jgi:hypothetical protein